MTRVLGTGFSSPAFASTTDHSVQISEAEDAASYYSAFQNFRHVYPNREQSLRRAIFHAIRGNRRIKRILDVGAADGKLLTAILEKLPNREIQVICLEPDEEAFQELRREANRWEATVRLVRSTVENYLRASSRDENRVSGFDLILCSHVYYHFPSPGELTKSLLDHLTPSGHLVITLDDHRSAPYQWLQRPLALFQYSRTSKYGHYLDSQEVERILRDSHLNFEHFLHSSRLRFETRRDLTSALEFLGRAQLQLPEKLMGCSLPLEVEWIEGIFSVRRAAISSCEPNRVR